VVALDSLDLENRRGKFLALLGPNGVDKTTAIDLLLGLRVPSAPRPIAASLAWLAGYGLLFFAVAAWAFRREEGRAFV
jgi:ATPase subunit of ABC transporter with duplicated ATPase domains